MTCLDDELVDEIPHGGRLGCGEHDPASSPHNNLQAGALDGGHLRDVLEAVELHHLQCSPHGHLSSNCYRGTESVFVHRYQAGAGLQLSVPFHSQASVTP